MVRQRQARDLRARRIVMYGVLGFLLASLLLSVAIETVRPQWRDPEFGHKLAKLLARTDRPIVALGSSRVLNGLRPSLLPDGSRRIFNFGLTRHGPVQQQLALERLLREGICPAAVTLEVFPLALALGATELDPVPANRHSLTDLRIAVSSGARPAIAKLDWLEARMVPWYAQRFVLMSHWLPNWVGFEQRQDYLWNATDADGWLELIGPRDLAESKRFRDQITAAEGPTLASFRIDPVADRALRDSIARLQQLAIPTRLILMPEAGWYRQLLSQAGQQALDDYLAQLSTECDIRVIDARGWCSDDNFRDGSHLVGRGVAMFTRRFEVELADLLNR